MRSIVFGLVCRPMTKCFATKVWLKHPDGSSFALNTDLRTVMELLQYVKSLSPGDLGNVGAHKLNLNKGSQKLEHSDLVVDLPQSSESDPLVVSALLPRGISFRIHHVRIDEERTISSAHFTNVKNLTRAEFLQRFVNNGLLFERPLKPIMFFEELKEGKTYMYPS